MAQYANRSELESQAKMLGYEPDRDDTDATGHHSHQAPVSRT